MWIPKVGQAVQVDNQGPAMLVESMSGSGELTQCTLRDETGTTAVLLSRLNPEGKARPRAGDHWDAADYLMCWEGEEYILPIKHNTSDMRLVALCKNAEAFAQRKGILIEGALKFFINFRHVLRTPTQHGHQFDCLMAWREAMLVQREEQKGYQVIKK